MIKARENRNTPITKPTPTKKPFDESLQRICLRRHVYYHWRELPQITFLLQKGLLGQKWQTHVCCDKLIFVVTKMLLVAAPVDDSLWFSFLVDASKQELSGEACSLVSCAAMCIEFGCLHLHCFSLRTLCRALRFINSHNCGSVARSLYEVGVVPYIPVFAQICVWTSAPFVCCLIWPFSV